MTLSPIEQLEADEIKDKDVKQVRVSMSRDGAFAHVDLRNGWTKRITVEHALRLIAGAKHD